MVFTTDALETLVKDKDGKTYASAFAPGTPRAVTFHGDGRITESAAPPEMLAAAGLEETKADNSARDGGSSAPQTAGSMLLKKLGVGTLARTVAVDAADTQIYIRRVDGVGVNLIGALSARNRQGELDLAQEDDMRGFMRAVIHVCTAQDAGGTVKLFDLVEAWDLCYAIEEAPRKLAETLFNLALETNPFLIEKGKAAQEQSEKKDAAPLA